MQGYGNFCTATKGLLRVNYGNLLGVAYVTRQLPDIGTTAYIELVKFLDALELFERQISMSVLLQTSASYLPALANRYKNIKIFCLDCEVEITDSLINRAVIGTILLQTRSPYEQQLSHGAYSQLHTSNDTWKLELPPILGTGITLGLATIAKMTTEQLTIENDKACKFYRETNEQGLLLLRKYKIAKAFGRFDPDLENAIKQYMTQINSAVDWVLFNSMYQMEVKYIEI